MQKEISKEQYQEIQKYYEKEFRPFLLNLSDILAEVVSNKDSFALYFFAQTITAILIHATGKIENDKGKLN